MEKKASHKDHRMLKNITKDSITNDLELIEFGLQLDLPLSIIKQKLHDYPRSI